MIVEPVRAHDFVPVAGDVDRTRFRAIDLNAHEFVTRVADGEATKRVLARRADAILGATCSVLVLAVNARI